MAAADEPPVPAPEPEPAAEPAPPPAPEPEPAPPPAPMPAPAPAPPPPPEEPRAQTETEKELLASYEPTAVAVGGYLQPQFRVRQNSPVQSDQDGFRFARVRLILQGQTRAGNLELSAYVEGELQPAFGLQDAYGTLARTFPQRRGLPGRISLDGGQMRVPISRQQMLSDSRLSFIDKAQIATIAPERDLGARLTVAPPKLPVKLIGGVFNGEGRNQVENINESYLYAARVELSPFGRDLPIAESAFGGKLLSVAGSYGHNRLARGNGDERRTYLGVDVTAAWKGVSAAFEYLEVRHRFRGGDPADDFNSNGFAAQLAYLLPIKLAPLKQGRLELAARIEEIDRDDFHPIPALGDDNQSVREITGVLSYYLRMHSLKAQLAFSHFDEVENMTATFASAVYDNDQLLLQITYRVE